MSLAITTGFATTTDRTLQKDVARMSHAEIAAVSVEERVAAIAQLVQRPGITSFNDEAAVTKIIVADPIPVLGALFDAGLLHDVHCSVHDHSRLPFTGNAIFPRDDARKTNLDSIIDAAVTRAVLDSPPDVANKLITMHRMAGFTEFADRLEGERQKINIQLNSLPSATRDSFSRV